MLTLVLADAEIETVPESMVDHPQVTAPADRKGVDPSRMLLDSSMHHNAMRDAGIDEPRRRGRPDLAHLFLVTVLDSTLNLEGGLRTIIHTRNHERVDVAPETRIPRTYERFKGLVEGLLEEGQAGPPDREPLLDLTRRKPLPAILRDLDADRVVALDPAGEDVEPTDELPRLAGEHDNVAVVLGGFPRGEYESPIESVADERWSIHDERLSVWVAAAEVTVPWRRITQRMSVHRGSPPRA